MYNARGMVLGFDVNILKPTARAFSPKKVSDTDAIIVCHTYLSHPPAIIIREYNICVLLYHTRVE